MSYMIDKFKAGEVKMRENVCGWYFPETDGFRPLMNDAMQELHKAGLVGYAQIDATAVARNIHTEQTIMAYAKSQEEFWSNPENASAQREQEAEMCAAFGPGETVVNVFTGKEHNL